MSAIACSYEPVTTRLRATAGVRHLEVGEPVTDGGTVAGTLPYIALVSEACE
jgi:hypothetical protein